MFKFFFNFWWKHICYVMICTIKVANLNDLKALKKFVNIGTATIFLNIILRQNSHIIISLNTLKYNI